MDRDINGDGLRLVPNSLPGDTMAVDLFSTFATDTSSEEVGVWFEDILDDGSGLGFQLRRYTSKAVEKARTKIWNANRKHLVKGKMPEAMDEKLAVELMATAVVVNWKGVADPNNPDQELPYSTDASVALLTKLPNLRRVIAALATNMDNFKAETREEVAGN